MTYGVLLYLRIISSLPTLFLLLTKLSVPSLPLCSLFHPHEDKHNPALCCDFIWVLRLPILAWAPVARGRNTFLGCCLSGRTTSDTGIKIVDVADAGFFVSVHSSWIGKARAAGEMSRGVNQLCTSNPTRFWTRCVNQEVIISHVTIRMNVLQIDGHAAELGRSDVFKRLQSALHR